VSGTNPLLIIADNLVLAERYARSLTMRRSEWRLVWSPENLRGMRGPGCFVVLSHLDFTSERTREQRMLAAERLRHVGFTEVKA
jgi:hypothetical protein